MSDQAPLADNDDVVRNEIDEESDGAANEPEGATNDADEESEGAANDADEEPKGAANDADEEPKVATDGSDEKPKCAANDAEDEPKGDAEDEPKGADDEAEGAVNEADGDTDTDNEKVGKRTTRSSKEVKHCDMCNKHVNISIMFCCPTCPDERCKMCVKNAIIRDALDNMVSKPRCVECKKEFSDETMTNFESAWQDRELRKAHETITDISHIIDKVLPDNIQLAQVYSKVRKETQLHAANPAAWKLNMDDAIATDSANIEIMLAAIGETGQMALRASVMEKLATVKGVQDALLTISHDLVAPSTRDRIAGSVIRISRCDSYVDDLKQESCKLKEDIKAVRMGVDQKRCMLRFVTERNSNTPANIMAMARKLHVNGKAASSEANSAQVPPPPHNPQYDPFMIALHADLANLDDKAKGKKDKNGQLCVRDDAAQEIKDILASVSVYMGKTRVQHFHDAATQHRKECELVACQLHCNEFGSESKMRAECYAIERTKRFFDEQDQAAYTACTAALAVIGCPDAEDRLSRIATYFNEVLVRLSKKFNNRCTYTISPAWEIATRSSGRKRAVVDPVDTNVYKRQATDDDFKHYTGMANAVLELLKDPINLARFTTCDNATRVEILADSKKMAKKPVSMSMQAVMPATSVVNTVPHTAPITSNGMDIDGQNCEVDMTGNPLYEKEA